MKKIIINIGLFFLFFSGINNLYSQSNVIKKESGDLKKISSDIKKTEPSLKKDKPVDVNSDKVTEVKEVKKKDIKKKIGKVKAVEQKIIKKKKTNYVTGKVNNETNISLIDIKDGNYKYVRIPGYKIEKHDIVSSENLIVKIPENKKSSEDVNVNIINNPEEGLFGLSKESTDLIAKGALVFLILIIFILYRMRSKKTNHNVLRRYPNK